MKSPCAQAVAIAAVCLCAATAHAETEGLPSEPACPVRLLSIEVSPSHGEDSPPAEGLELSSEGLRYLKSLPTPLYIVPMLGVYRGGKSLLLNRLMGLSAPYPRGFGVGHGQETYTRGIHMCGEIVPDVGSVVWMDTEGLFSAEDARSAYGPKIFSLALLFSSMVLLNSVKVFNDQFFAYFGEQQQVARVLKQGLIAEGLPHGSLLPANLTVLWVLQQPVRFDAAGMATQQQLHTFLNAAGDEYRAHVQRDFRHLNFEVPSAAHDVRSWGRLDKLPDDELSVEYTRAVVELRETVLQNLAVARPLHPSSVAKQLEMYVQAVQTEQFSISLAREAFEEEQIGILCDKYWRTLLLHAGQLPSSGLQDARSLAREELEPQLAAATVEFHFTSSWSLRAVNCWKMKEEELDKKNEEAVMKEWKAAATSAAQGGSCFFLRDLVVLLNRDQGDGGGLCFGTTEGSIGRVRAPARCLGTIRTMVGVASVELLHARKGDRWSPHGSSPCCNLAWIICSATDVWTAAWIPQYRLPHSSRASTPPRHCHECTTHGAVDAYHKGLFCNWCDLEHHSAATACMEYGLACRPRPHVR